MARDHPLHGGASQQVGRYQIQSHIASGGMGAVYLAFDPLLNRTVALKVLSPEMAAKPNMVARFHREAKSAARLRHDHIVQIFDVGEASGTYFLALEFVDGTDLQDYIEQRPGGRLDPDEAVFVTIQAAKALDHAYAQGIVHRDIKPSNFLITTKSGKLFIKLTDMGLARTEDDSRITRDNTTLGTVDYISPEQARDSSAADTRSDLYSLGCSLYHMLVGHAPYPKGSLIEKVQHHLYTPAPDVRSSRPDVPDALADILFKLLEKNPDDRYETPLHLLHDLMAPAEFTKYRSDTQDLHPASFIPPTRHKRPVDATVSLSKIDELPPPDPLFPADFRTAAETEAEAAPETRRESKHEPSASESRQETEREPEAQPISVELTPEEPAPADPAPAAFVVVPEKAVEKANEKPVEKPVEKPIEKPVDKPPPRAVSPVAEKPAAERAAPSRSTVAATERAHARVERPAVRPIEKHRPSPRPKTEPPAAAPAPPRKPVKKRPVTPAAQERLRRREVRRLWQSPLWLGGIGGGLLLLAFLTWAAMALFSRPRLDPGPIAVEPPPTDPRVKPKIDPPPVDPKADPPKVDPPKVDPKDPPKVDPPKVDPPKIDPPKVDPPMLDPPPVDAKMGPPDPPALPLAKVLDAAGLEREVLGPHTEIAPPAPGVKVLKVNRGKSPRGDSFAFFADAWREAGKLPAAVIEIDDAGPLPIPTLTAIAGHDVTIRGAAGVRPLLVWDIRSRETSRNWMPIDSGKLVIEGVDILVRDESLNDGEPLACFQVGGSAFLRDVTLTQTGGPRPGVALVRVGPHLDAAKGSGLVRIDRSYLRGRGVLAADMAAGGDLLVDGSLALGKSRPSVLVSAPTSQLVNVRFHRSTLASSKAVVQAMAETVAPRVCLFGLDSIFACPSPDEAGAFLALGESVGVSGLTSRIAHCAYTGWPTLLVGRQTRLASLAEWRKHWGHAEGDVVLDAPWPPLPPALDAAEAIDFSPLASPLAYRSTRERGLIGCPVGKLPDLPLQGRLRPAPAAPLEFPASGMPALEPGDGEFYTGEVLDLSKGNVDLGAYLAGKKLAPRVVIHLAGRGYFPSSPLQAADTQLVLYSTADNPILDFRTTNGAPALALIDVQRGSLEMINVRIRTDWKRLPETPASFIRVRDGALHLTHCLVQTPLTRVPDEFRSLVTLEGVAADAPAKFTCRDSVLLSGASALAASGPAALVRWRNNFALGMDDLISLAPSPVKSGQMAGLFEYNTFAAQKAFARVATPPGKSDDARPGSIAACSILARDNHFTTPTDSGSMQLLRLEGDGVARGLLAWKSQGNAYDVSAIDHPLAWGKEVAATPFPQSWVDYWGSAAVVDPVLITPKTTAKFNVEQPTLDRFVLPSTLRVDVPGANFPQLVPLLYPPKKKA